MKQIIPFSTLAVSSVTNTQGRTFTGFQFRSYGIPLHQGFFTTTDPRYFADFQVYRNADLNSNFFYFAIKSSIGGSGGRVTGDTERLSPDFEANGKWIVEVPGLSTLEFNVIAMREPYEQSYAGSLGNGIRDFLAGYVVGTAGRLILDDGANDGEHTQTFVYRSSGAATTWVVPDGVNSVDVELVGSGGGGEGGGWTGSGSGGSDGAAALFDALSAPGGTRGRQRTGGSVEGGIAGLAGGRGRGTSWGRGGRSGSRAVEGLTYFGKGGDGGQGDSNAGNGAGGGAYLRIPAHAVTPSETISYTVPRSGQGGTGGGDNGRDGSRGTSGAVRLGWNDGGSEISLSTNLRATGRGAARLTVEKYSVNLRASLRATGAGSAQLTIIDSNPGIQVIQLAGTEYAHYPSANFKLWLLSAPPPTIESAFTPPGKSPRTLFAVSITSRGVVGLTFSSSDTTDDLSDKFERSGTFTIETDTLSLTVRMAGNDLTEPYNFTPSNSAEVRAFYNALSTENGATPATLTLRDFDPNPPSVSLSANLRTTGKGTARLTVAEPPAVSLSTELRATGKGTARLTVVEPPSVSLSTSLRSTGKGTARLTVTEPSFVSLTVALSATGKGTARLTVSDVVAISDWTVLDYQTPIVLALLEATVSGVDLTVDPVTAIEGDLIVASDLTIDGVERHDPPQSPLRLRRSGGGDFLTYFRSNGTYPNTKLWIVVLTPTGPVTIPFSHGASGGGYSNWNLDTASQRATFDAIASGTRFVLAMAEPVVHIDLSTSFRATGKGTARLTVRGVPAVSLSTSFRATGKGTARLTIREVLSVSLSTSLRSTGKGTARLTVRGVPAVSLSTSFRATGKGAARLTIREVLAVSLSTELRATGKGTARLTVAGPDLSIFDWTVLDYQTPIVLALLEATVSGVDLTVDPVTAIEGDLIVASDLTIDGVERHDPPQSPLRLRRSGGGDFSTYFGNAGTPQYPNAKMWIVLDDADRTHIPFTIGNTGSGFNNWTIDANDQRDLINAIATNDRFLLAIAEPIVPVALSVDLRAVGKGTARLTVRGVPAVSLSTSFRATGKGTARLTIREVLAVSLSTELRATGKGTARLTITEPSSVSLTIDLRAIGRGTARLTVTESPAVNLGTRLRAAGKGTARLTIRGAVDIPLSVNLRSTGKGTARLTITEPPSVSLSTDLRATGKGTARLTVSDVVAISDWTVLDYQTPIVLALLEATVSGVDLTVDPVTAIEGDLIVGDDLTIDGVERHPPGQPLIRLRRSGGGDFSTYFGSGNTYENAKLWIVVSAPTGPVTIPFSHGASGGGYSNWNLDTASQRATFDAIASGTRFVLAMAEPVVHIDLSTSFRATGKGTARLTVRGVPAVSLSTSFRATGKGTARLTVRGVPAVSLSTSLRSTGKGTARLTVAPSGSVSLSVDLRATGKGTARLTVPKAPTPVRPIPTSRYASLNKLFDSLPDINWQQTLGALKSGNPLELQKASNALVRIRQAIIDLPSYIAAAPERIYAPSATAVITSQQYPDNAWGYREPKTVNSLAWVSDQLSPSDMEPYVFASERLLRDGVPLKGSPVVDLWTAPIIIATYTTDLGNIAAELDLFPYSHQAPYDLRRTDFGAQVDTGEWIARNAASQAITGDINWDHVRFLDFGVRDAKGRNRRVFFDVLDFKEPRKIIGLRVDDQDGTRNIVGFQTTGAVTSLQGGLAWRFPVERFTSHDDGVLAKIVPPADMEYEIRILMPWLSLGVRSFFSRTVGIFHAEVSSAIALAIDGLAHDQPWPQAATDIADSLPPNGSKVGDVVILFRGFDVSESRTWDGTSWIPFDGGLVGKSLLVTGGITTPKLAAGAVTAIKIAAEAITVGKLAAGAVTAEKILDRTILGTKIADGTITSTNIQALTIVADLIGVGSVLAEKIAAGAILAEKIGAGAILADKIAAGAVTAIKIAAGAITADKIVAGLIPTDLADLTGQLGTQAIENAAIVASKIAAGAIVASKIKAGAITADKIVAGLIPTALADLTGQLGTQAIEDAAIVASKIAAGAIVASKIEAGAIVASKIGAGAITVAKIQDGAVSTTKIQGGAITTNKIAARAIVAELIGATAIIAEKIAAGAVITDKIAAGAIIASKIAAGAITADKIFAGVIPTDLSDLTGQIGTQAIENAAIVASKIAAGAITANKIVAGLIPTDLADLTGQLGTQAIENAAIVASKIAAGAIVASKIKAGAITADKIVAGLIPTALADLTGQLGTQAIQDAAIVASKIAAGAILAEKIGAGAILAEKIGAGAILADKIAAGAIISPKIGAGVILTKHLAAGVILAKHIAAGTIVAGNIAAGAIELGSAVVHGVLTAGHISGDLQNFAELWRGKFLVTGTTYDFPVSRPWRTFDTIVVMYVLRNERDAGALTIDVASIPSTYVNTQSSTYAIRWFSNTHGRGTGDSIHLRIYDGSTVNRLRLWLESANEAWIIAIQGFRNPEESPNTSTPVFIRTGDAGGGDPPAVLPTTVSANAGANKTVESGGSVGVGGADSITNPVGSTGISWASPIQGSLSSRFVASPTFNAPTIAAGGRNVTVTLTKTVTNNGVSDSGSVTITVTAPGVPTTTTTVSANAGSNETVDSGGSVGVGGADSITNPVGSTGISWASPSQGSLSSRSVASPTFNAPTIAAGGRNVTVTLTKTVTNNGVSGTDTVSITVTAPAAPPTIVSANAGANKTVESGGSVEVGGADSITNPVGSTTITWSNPSQGSLSSRSVASPTFNAPTIAAGGRNVTVTLAKVVRNNGVTDSDTVAITVTAPGVPTTTTTVSANAGSNETVDSGGSVGVGGADSITNPVGSTGISWASPSQGSLSSRSVASPTFNAPTIAAGGRNVTVTLTKTVTNNGVSDSDTVAITVTAPAAPPTPTTVSANAGANKTVESGGSVEVGGADSITNPVGSTRITWSNPSRGSLSSRFVASPTFNAPTLSPGGRNVTFNLAKVVANNGVSDSDTVAITVTAPATLTTTPSFSSSSGVDRAWTQGQSITAFTIPRATGSPTPSYSASGLPTGVVFSSTSRRVSGSPSSVGSGTIVITAMNTAGSDTYSVDWTVQAVTTLPNASAPSVTISTTPENPYDDENTTLSASVSGGVYDTLSYAWEIVSGGGSISGSGASVLYVTPTVGGRTAIEVRCTVTARGTGSTAKIGTSATRITYYSFDVLSSDDGGGDGK